MDVGVDVDSGYEMERVVLEETPKDSAYGRGWPSPVELGWTVSIVVAEWLSGLVVASVRPFFGFV